MSLFEPEHVIHVDGASRGNPGHASYGFVILDREGTVVHEGSGYIGLATNNFAEYTALIKALEFCLAKNINTVEIRTDSQLLARQITGEYRVKSASLQQLHIECKQLLRKFAWHSIKHVPREQNRLADALANQALDNLPR